MSRPARAGAFICFLALISAWPAAAPVGAAPRSLTPSAEQVRSFVSHAAVRIDVETSDTHGICTGWIGWSEEARSAAYTAAHCFRAGAHYRLTPVGSDEGVYANSVTRWESLDLMVLWFPRGGLVAIRFWKPIPAGPFRALYALSDRGAPLRLVDVSVPRVYWEVHFNTHPVAVAVPLFSAPGTSGAPVVDLADGALVGMIVGFAVDRPDLAAVIPAQSIYDLLISTPRR
ncbi:MAG TPA: trypsin-like peptidase domain-containing protein [bacterium]